MISVNVKNVIFSFLCQYLLLGKGRLAIFIFFYNNLVMWEVGIKYEILQDATILHITLFVCSHPERVRHEGGHFYNEILSKIFRKKICFILKFLYA